MIYEKIELIKNLYNSYNKKFLLYSFYYIVFNKLFNSINCCSVFTPSSSC